MVEKNSPHGGLCGRPERYSCINVNKVFDSAKDKDCLEDVRVYICDTSQDIIDRASAVRTKNIEVINTNINIETVPFNKGYYQVTIRYYFCVTLEACVNNGCVQEVKGLCAFDKKIILYGSEKNVSVFTSDPEKNSFCFDESDLRCESASPLPTVVVEVAAPICLDTKVIERTKEFGSCCMCLESIPERVRERFSGEFVDCCGKNRIYISIGVFSVIRMERQVQLMIPVTEFCIPEHSSKPNECSDPCNVFGKLQFPMEEFYPYAEDQIENDRRRGNDKNCT